MPQLTEESIALLAKVEAAHGAAARAEIEPILEVVEKLHGGVVYGGGLQMFNQVLRAANIAFEQATPKGDMLLLKAVLGHKFQEGKRIKGGVPLTEDRVREVIGNEAAAIVFSVKEPEERVMKDGVPVLKDDKEVKKKPRDYYIEVARWARDLPDTAKKLLMVEKIVNFHTSIDQPNPDWKPEKHKEYFETRFKVVAACLTADRGLYDIAKDLKEQGLDKFTQRT